MNYFKTAIIAHTNQNERVYEFILDYLVSGFEKLHSRTPRLQRGVSWQSFTTTKTLKVQPAHQHILFRLHNLLPS